MVFLPVHTPQACDMILHQSLALTIQLSVPWYTHPLHDSVPSAMSHLGSCMQIPLIIHYIVMFHGHDNIMPTCYNTAQSAAPAASPYPPKPPPGQLASQATGISQPSNLVVVLHIYDKPGLPILCHISWLTCLSREPLGALYPPGLLPGSRDTPAGEALTFPHTFAWFCVLPGPFQPNPASVPRPSPGADPCGLYA